MIYGLNSYNHYGLKKSQPTQAGGISTQQVEANTNQLGETQLHLRPQRPDTDKIIKFQGK